MAARFQARIGYVGAGSAFAALQSAGTMPLFTGAIGAAAGAGGGALWAAINSPKVNEASRTAADATRGATKATGETAAQAFMDAAPPVKRALEDAMLAMGDYMVIGRDNAAKVFADTMPVVNEIFKDVVKGAGRAVVNVQQNVAKAFEVTKPWMIRAIGKAMRATERALEALR